MGACACAFKNTGKKYETDEITANEINQISEQVEAIDELNTMKNTLSVVQPSMKRILSVRQKTNGSLAEEQPYHQCQSLVSNRSTSKQKTVSYNSKTGTIIHNTGTTYNISSYMTELEEKYSNSQSKISQQPQKNKKIQKQTAKHRNWNFNQCSMLEKGMSPSDNAIIQRSLNIQTPIKLQAIELQVGVTYHGEWRNAMRHGYGIQVWEDGSRFQGHWEDNQINGQGTLHYYDGDVYEGAWRDDSFHGSGKYTCLNGHFYEGEWSDNKKQGKGHQTWEDGEDYIGEFKDGSKHGRGCLKFKDGSYYEGEFACNQINGRGKYVWINSREYDGDWTKNKMCGFGIHNWNDGRYYKGQFANDKRHGKGEMYYTDGTRYVGNWVNGKESGHGQIYEGTKLKTVSQWKDGKKVKKNNKYESSSTFSR